MYSEYTVISDAFESVTNGMSNPEAMDALMNFDRGGESNDWKNIILAIRSFYNQDFSSLERLLESVNDDSEAGRLKPVLCRMAGMETERTTRLGKYEEKLLRAVTEDSRFLAGAAAQLNESMEYGEDLFNETASLIIREIRAISVPASMRLALWALNTCLERGFDEEQLADSILVIFGQAEGLRLIALSLIEPDPESALICLTRAMIRKIIDRTLDRQSVPAWLEVIEALADAVPAGSEVLIDMSELLQMLEDETAACFGFGSHGISALPASERIRRLKAGLAGADPAPSDRIRTAAVPAGQPLQLELF